jgi:hypothetical protein
MRHPMQHRQWNWDAHGWRGHGRHGWGFMPFVFGFFALFLIFKFGLWVPLLVLGALIWMSRHQWMRHMDTPQSWDKPKRDESSDGGDKPKRDDGIEYV